LIPGRLDLTPTTERGETEHPEGIVRRVLDAAAESLSLSLPAGTLLALLRDGSSGAARTRGVSERTFRRQLERAGIHVMDLKVTLRRELASQLREEGVSISVAANLLGFGHVESYRRFLRRYVPNARTRVHRLSTPD